MKTQPSTIPSFRFKAFSLVFAFTFPVIYFLSDLEKWPVFTYYPATNLLQLGWQPSNDDNGPGMYWYGWILTASLSGAVLGGLAAILPESISKKIPVNLSWIIPLLLTPALIYSLKHYWR